MFISMCNKNSDGCLIYGHHFNVDFTQRLSCDILSSVLPKVKQKLRFANTKNWCLRKKPRENQAWPSLEVGRNMIDDFRD